MALLAACDRSPAERREPQELETVEVGGGIDAELTTDLDEQARPVEVEIGGVLPGDFPPDLPVMTPANIVDFGRLAAGRSFVELDTPVPIDEARPMVGAQLQRSGWAVETIGESGNTYTRGSRQVRVVLSGLGTGSRIRYEY